MTRRGSDVRLLRSSPFYQLHEGSKQPHSLAYSHVAGPKACVRGMLFLPCMDVPLEGGISYSMVTVPFKAELPRQSERGGVM